MPAGASVEYRNVSRLFGEAAALQTFDLFVRPGEFLTILGPSGCGKTTVLRLLGGFLAPTIGSIFIDGREVTRLPPQKRGVGMVFQDYALFPHLTVRDNVGFGLVERRKSKKEIAARVDELLSVVSLGPLGGRYPAQLSGGQKQRVAVARALAIEPKVLLMDEPLGALDVKLRLEMQTELRRIQRQTRVTTLYVTHDQEEAFNMSDRVVVMQRGRIIQLGEPREIYQNPATPFVADFVGQINMIRATWLGAAGPHGMARLENGHLIGCKTRAELCFGQEITLGVRPECVLLRACASDGAGLVGRVRSLRYAGPRQFITVQTPVGAILVQAPSDVGEETLIDADVELTLSSESIHIWSKEIS